MAELFVINGFNSVYFFAFKVILASISLLVGKFPPFFLLSKLKRRINMKKFLVLKSLTVGIAALVKHYSRVAKREDEADNTQMTISIGKHDSEKPIEEPE